MEYTAFTADNAGDFTMSATIIPKRPAPKRIAFRPKAGIATPEYAKTHNIYASARGWRVDTSGKRFQ